METLVSIQTGLVDYLELTLKECCEQLKLPYNVVRTSTLELEGDLRGQARIIEAVKRLNGSRYINPPGGRDLYDLKDFDRAGITLSFLPEFNGDQASILQRPLSDSTDDLRQEITTQLV